MGGKRDFAARALILQMSFYLNLNKDEFFLQILNKKATTAAATTSILGLFAEGKQMACFAVITDLSRIWRGDYTITSDYRQAKNKAGLCEARRQ